MPFFSVSALMCLFWREFMANCGSAAFLFVQRCQFSAIEACLPSSALLTLFPERPLNPCANLNPFCPRQHTLPVEELAPGPKRWTAGPRCLSVPRGKPTRQCPGDG